MSDISNESFTAANLVCRHWRKTAPGAKGRETRVAATTVPDFERQSELSHPAGQDRKLGKQPKKMGINDFEMLKVVGKGSTGKVLLVRHKPTSDLFAMKVIAKRDVLARKQLRGILTEQAILRRVGVERKEPFVVKLWRSFHDRENLFLVMDFYPGGDLATQLIRWRRFGRDRARFYAAEIVEGVECLHKHGIIYRDLKPENVLIGSDGHIVLTDFGLSKQFPRLPNVIAPPPTPNGIGGEPIAGGAPRFPSTEKDPPNGIPSAGTETTNTFCGTAHYLAPEVIQALPYSFEVDWWSFGTMLFEMLAGIVRTLSVSPRSNIRSLFCPDSLLGQQSLRHVFEDTPG